MSKKEKVFTDEQIRDFHEYQQQYMRTKYRSYTFRFDRNEDPEIIAKLDNMKSITAYVRNLIRADMGYPTDAERENEE